MLDDMTELVGAIIRQALDDAKAGELYHADIYAAHEFLREANMTHLLRFAPAPNGVMVDRGSVLETGYSS